MKLELLHLYLPPLIRDLNRHSKSRLTQAKSYMIYRTVRFKEFDWA